MTTHMLPTRPLKYLMDSMARLSMELTDMSSIAALRVDSMKAEMELTFHIPSKELVLTDMDMVL